MQQFVVASELRLCIINAIFQFFDAVGVVPHPVLEPPHLIAELIVVKLAFALALALTLALAAFLLAIALALALAAFLLALARIMVIALALALARIMAIALALALALATHVPGTALASITC